MPRRNSVGHADSVEKILAQIALLSPDTVRYQPTTPAGRVLRERVFDTPTNEVLVTPSLFRKFICTAGCTACCQKFTLDFTPHEYHTMVEHKEGFSERAVQVNGKKKVVYTNDQNQNPICDFLRVERPDGGLGCAHYPTPPLSCISAPQLQFIQVRPGKTYVLKKPFGRAWAMTPTPQCQFVPFEGAEEALQEIDMMVGILDRFSEWARYFGIKTTLGNVTKFLRKSQKAGLMPTQAIAVWKREV